MRISDWSSDLCSSDLRFRRVEMPTGQNQLPRHLAPYLSRQPLDAARRGIKPDLDLGQRKARLVIRHREVAGQHNLQPPAHRDPVLRGNHRFGAVEAPSEENTSELQSLIRITYAD